MNKGFINLALIIIGAVVIVGGLIFGNEIINQKINNEIENTPTRFNNDGLLGAASGSGNFPTSFNNFQDNDIIQALDWSKIEWTIGTTTEPTGGFSSSTATSTLWYKLVNPASSNPGHIHTTSTITDITYLKKVSEGGTATTTFARGLVMASGTDAFTSLQTNGNGSIPIASGTTWVANVLTEGQNITITTTSPGRITIASPNVSGIKLSQDTADLTVANSTALFTIATSTIAANVLGTTNGVSGKVFLYPAKTGGQTVNLTFNMYYGATLMASTSVVSTEWADTNSTIIELEANLFAAASASAQEGSLKVSMISQSTTNFYQKFAIGTASIDSTVSQNLIITAQYSGSPNANSTYTRTNYIFYKIVP